MTDINMQMLDIVTANMQAQTRTLRGDVNSLTNVSQRSETAGGVPAYTLADAPTNADGGMSNGQFNIDMIWVSNGRKPTEGAGLGTGVLAIWSGSAYLRVGDYTAVVI